MVVVEELSDDNDEVPTADEHGKYEQNQSSNKIPTPAEIYAAKESSPPQDPHKKEVGKQEVNVFCNVYEITPRLNKLLRCCCLRSWGIYHTGVQVYDREFAFGGHAGSTTGVWAGKPRAVEGARFMKQVPIGWTELDPQSLRKRLATLAPEWPGVSYDPMKRNCNHFSSFLCTELTGIPAPAYTNRCAESRLVRCVFYKCLSPMARCLGRWQYKLGFVTYQVDEVEATPDREGKSDFCVHGARGMNEVLVEAATAIKTDANNHFRAGAYDQAAQMYVQALGLLRSLSRLDEDLELDSQVMKEAADVCMALLLNIAACNLKAQDWDRAVHCCKQVLDCDSDNAKAWFRKGVALSHLGHVEEAISDLKKALSLTSTSDSATQGHIKQEISRVQALT